MTRTVGALLLLLLSYAPLAAADRVSVLELFTSQGCSSCPAADKLLGELAGRDGVLALSMPVDYWDYIGWKDTLASPAFSARQRAYAKARGDRAVYTPQLVFNGLVHTVGSNRTAISEALKKTNARRHSVAVELQERGGEIVAEIGAGPRMRASVILVVYEPSATVSIKRGENAGKTITYHNVVRRIVPLGDWNGAAETYTAKAPAGVRCAVIVQAGTQSAPGEILGAAAL